MDTTDSTSLLQQYLRPGETLDWVGRPDPSALAERTVWHLGASILGLVIFAVMITGPMGASLLSAPGEGSDAIDARWLVAIFGVFWTAFLVVSAHRFLSNWRHHYALTSARVLILNSLWPARLKSYEYGIFYDMARKGGSIEFGDAESPPIQFGLIRGYSLKFRPRLAGLSEPAKVEAMIRDKIVELYNS